ncbi:hypothetical protein SLE2022_265290 [Rubroshorea leprosula]
MERDPDTAPLYSTQGGPPERGGGGKLRRPPPRRPTPYARPQQSQLQGSHWLSKLVDPARRFIAGGATRIFPYLFSKSTADNSLPAPTNETNDNSDADVHQNANGDQLTYTPNFGVSKSTDVAETNSIVEVSKTVSGFEEERQAKKSNLMDTDGLSEIEQLMRDKKFSRDEINHLIEIINSRAVDVPNVDQERKELGMSGEGANRPIVSYQTPRKSDEEKNEDFSKALWGLSTPFHQSIIKDEVGASPIEIARAYMENRTSEISLGGTNIASDDARPPLLGNDFSLKPYVPPSSSSKPSACWPGAMVPDQQAYISPESQRSRFGLHSFPRTPYSRNIFSKSKSKLASVQADFNSSLNNSKTPLQLSQTPSYRQLRGRAVDDGRGSVGPIRRIRMQHRVATESPSRVSVYSHSWSNGPSPLENSNVSKGILPAIKKNLEPGEASSSSLFQSVDGSKSRNSELGTPIVHPHSSQIARTILEHLERNLPTPKDKSNELKLATSWRKTQSSDAATVMLKENNSLSYFGGLDYSKSKDQLDKKTSSQWNRDGTNLPPMSLPQSTIGSKDAVNRKTSASDINVDDTVKLFSDNAEPSLDFWKMQDSQSMHKFSTTVTNAAGSGSPQKPPSNSLGNKPVLPAISISKPVHSWRFSLENSSGFSFPISAPSGASSEPPTPSIMPSVSATALPQSKEESVVPSFSFGSNTSSLVFSFPSSSSAPNHVDSSDIKFNFGADRSKRISFAPVGKDAICY